MKSKETQKKRKYNEIVILLMPILLVGILGPLEIFSGNYEEFSFSMYSVIGVMGICSIVAFIVLMGIYCIIPSKLHDLFLSVVFDLSIAAYIQYLFLNTVLSRDDGNYMVWSEYKGLIIVNSIIWLIMIGLLVICQILFKVKWEKIRKFLATACLVVQMLAIVSIIITVPKGDDSEYRFRLNDKYVLGADNNVVIIMVDTYGNELADMTHEKYPELFDGLKDFTYYDNADCVYYRTYPSMTHMLTGQKFNYNSEVRSEYCDMAWSAERTDEIYGKIHDSGYSMNIYADNEGSLYFGHLKNMVGKVDNVQYRHGDVLYKRILYHFGKESIYIFAPYLLKPYVEEVSFNFTDIVDFGEYYSDYEHDLYDELVETGLSVSDSDRKRILYYETFGIHCAYLDENCNASSDSTVESTVKGCHTFVEEYLEQMKKLGVYDSSTIIVLADHGSWNTFIEMDPQPVFFIKRPYEEHESISINHAPIDYTEVLPTILSSVGIDNSEYGKTVFDEDENLQKERTVYHQNAEYEYYGYTYIGDKKELLETISDGPDTIEKYVKGE